MDPLLIVDVLRHGSVHLEGGANYRTTLLVSKRLYDKHNGSFTILQPGTVTFGRFIIPKDLLVQEIIRYFDISSGSGSSYELRATNHLDDLTTFDTYDDVHQFLDEVLRLTQNQYGIMWISELIGSGDDASLFPAPSPGHSEPPSQLRLDYLAQYQFGVSFEELSSSQQLEIARQVDYRIPCRVNYGSTDPTLIVRDRARCICRECGKLVCCVHQYLLKHEKYRHLLMNLVQEGRLLMCRHCGENVISLSENPPLVGEILQIFSLVDSFTDLPGDVKNRLKYDKTLIMTMVQDITKLWSYNCRRSKPGFVTLRLLVKTLIDWRFGLPNSRKGTLQMYVDTLTHEREVSSTTAFYIKPLLGYGLLKALWERICSMELTDQEFIDAIYTREELLGNKDFDLRSKFVEVVSPHLPVRGGDEASTYYAHVLSVLMNLADRARVDSDTVVIGQVRGILLPPFVRPRAG